MRTGWRIRSFVLIVSMILTIVGCKKKESSPAGTGGAAGSTTSGQNLTKVKLALNWKPEPQFGGFYAAKDIGAYASHGLDVEIQPGGSGTPTVQMVAAGQVEFGIVSADELVIARSRGADVVALFATYQTNPQGIMTHASRGFKDIGEVFKGGGTLAMQRGLPYAEFLVNKFGENGVKIVPYAGGIGIFLKDKQFSQQCFVTSEPILAKKQGADEKTFLIAGAGYNPYTTVLVTRGNYLRNKQHESRQMTRAVREGWRAYLDNPAKANETMAKLNPSMDAEAIAASAEAQKVLIEPKGYVVGLGGMTTDRWQALIGQLSELKVIDVAPHADDCFIVVPK